MPKPTNLEYDANTPSFLRKLKAQYNDTSSSSYGRSNYNVVRPKANMDRLDMGDGGEEDGPVVVGEDGREVRGDVEGVGEDVKGVGEDVKGVGEEGEGEGKEKVEGEEKGERRGEGGAIAGVSKKRKVGKVIAASEEEPAEEEDGDRERSNKQGVTDSKANGKQASERKAAMTDKEGKKDDTRKDQKKTTSKKIKLSFDEPE